MNPVRYQQDTSRSIWISQELSNTALIISLSRTEDFWSKRNLLGIAAETDKAIVLVMCANKLHI